MEFNMTYAYAAIAAVVLYFLYKHFTSTSNFTTGTSFNGLNVTDADTLYKSKTSELATELSGKLSDAITAKNSTDSLIALSSQYADYANQLNKDYAAYKIRQIPTTPAPA